MDQQKWFWKLEVLMTCDLLIFPSSRSSSRIDIRRISVGTELGWGVTLVGKPLSLKKANPAVFHIHDVEQVRRCVVAAILRSAPVAPFEPFLSHLPVASEIRSRVTSMKTNGAVIPLPTATVFAE